SEHRPRAGHGAQWFYDAEYLRLRYSRDEGVQVWRELQLELPGGGVQSVQSIEYRDGEYSTIWDRGQFGGCVDEPEPSDAIRWSKNVPGRAPDSARRAF